MNGAGGDELVRWLPTSLQADRIYTFPAAGNVFPQVHYLGGYLYTEEIAVAGTTSCQSDLYKLTTNGAVVARVPTGSTCVGGWDTAPGVLTEDDGLGTAFYFDPMSLNTLGSATTGTGSEWYLADSMAPDGSWITARGTGPVDCATADVRRVAITGTIYQATMPSILGLTSGEDCSFGGVVVTTSGDIVVLASDPQGTYLVRIHGQTVAPTLIDSQAAFDLHLAADGGGAVVAAYDDLQPCQDPTGSTYQCAQLHLLKFTPASGGQQVIATVGGTWGQSTRTWRSSGLGVANGSVTTGDTSTADYFCGVNCGLASSTQSLRIFPANVTYQTWHNPS